MWSGHREAPVAAGEQMLLHVDTGGPRAAAFDSDVEDRLRELADAHTLLPPPRFAGRVIGLSAGTRRNGGGHV
jgi:acyl-CoA thioester hydrolase